MLPIREAEDLTCQKAGGWIRCLGEASCVNDQVGYSREFSGSSDRRCTELKSECRDVSADLIKAAVELYEYKWQKVRIMTEVEAWVIRC